MEHTIISLWDGPEVLDGGSIPDWDLGPGSTNPAIDADSTLEQLELEADDWPGFVAMVKARSGRMS